MIQVDKASHLRDVMSVPLLLGESMEEKLTILVSSMIDMTSEEYLFGRDLI